MSDNFLYYFFTLWLTFMAFFFEQVFGFSFRGI